MDVFLSSLAIRETHKETEWVFIENGILSNWLGYKREGEVVGGGGLQGEREDHTVTNDCEHLLISLEPVIRGRQHDSMTAEIWVV